MTSAPDNAAGPGGLFVVVALGFDGAGRAYLAPLGTSPGDRAAWDPVDLPPAAADWAIALIAAGYRTVTPPPMRDRRPAGGVVRPWPKAPDIRADPPMRDRRPAGASILRAPGACADPQPHAPHGWSPTGQDRHRKICPGVTVAPDPAATAADLRAARCHCTDGGGITIVDDTGVCTLCGQPYDRPART